MATNRRKFIERAGFTGKCLCGFTFFVLLILFPGMHIALGNPKGTLLVDYSVRNCRAPDMFYFKHTGCIGADKEKIHVLMP